MKNKKILLLIISLLVLLLIIILITINGVPKKINTILTSNSYEQKNYIEAGTTYGNFTYSRNTYKYQSGKSVIMVYEWESLSEIKDERLAEYNQFKSNSNYTVTLDDKDEYIYMRACSKVMCNYYLGYELEGSAELVATIAEFDLKDELDDIFNQILKDKKLI